MYQVCKPVTVLWQLNAAAKRGFWPKSALDMQAHSQGAGAKYRSRAWMPHQVLDASAAMLLRSSASASKVSFLVLWWTHAKQKAACRQLQSSIGSAGANGTAPEASDQDALPFSAAAAAATGQAQQGSFLTSSSLYLSVTCMAASADTAGCCRVVRLHAGAAGRRAGRQGGRAADDGQRGELRAVCVVLHVFGHSSNLYVEAPSSPVRSSIHPMRLLRWPLWDRWGYVDHAQLAAQGPEEAKARGAKWGASPQSNMAQLPQASAAPEARPAGPLPAPPPAPRDPATSLQLLQACAKYVIHLDCVSPFSAESASWRCPWRATSPCCRTVCHPFRMLPLCEASADLTSVCCLSSSHCN